ncbi:MAG: hypothetical protein P8J93_07270 [SAR86 cluster bacterium]|nr:hypothetical protein [SAR86 cluster bacterium]|tara:strand:- start:9204 stop:9389 length:186 start_codon:yes stop_codon:yes gene_type:complete
MNDVLKNNKPSGMPMAWRLELELKNTTQSGEWIDRLITSIYLAITGSIVSIFIALSLGLSI